MKIIHIDYSRLWLLPCAQFLQAVFPFFIIKYTHDKGQEKLTHYISANEVLTKQAYLGTYKDRLTLDAFRKYNKELYINYYFYFRRDKSGKSLIIRRDKLKLPSELYFFLHRKQIKHRINKILYELVASLNKDFEFVYFEDFKAANCFMHDGRVYCLDFDNIFVRQDGKICKIEDAR